MTNVQLDKENDVLYIALYDMSNSYGDENEMGVVVFRDLVTEKITGLTIFDFLSRYRNKEILSLKLPVDIDFDRDIYPSLNLR